MGSPAIEGEFVCKKCSREFGYRLHFMNHKRVCEQVSPPDEIARRWRGGETVNEIAEEEGVSRSFVTEHLRAGGVTKDETIAENNHGRKRTPLPVPVDVFIRLHQSGMPISRISGFYGVSRMIIYSRMREVDYEPQEHSVASVPYHGRLYDLPDWAPQPQSESGYAISSDSCERCGARVDVINGYCLFCREDGHAL